MIYSWKYKKLDRITYNILPPGQIESYINEFIRKEWEVDHEEYPDQLWTLEWLNSLKTLTFSLRKIRLDEIVPRQDLMDYVSPEDNFRKSLETRADERETSLLRGVSVEPLLVKGQDLELMDGYTRYTVMRRYGCRFVYAYCGEVGHLRLPDLNCVLSSSFELKK